ncbi:MAG: GNAT family protein [Methylococcaceae bacterium]
MNQIIQSPFVKIITADDIHPNDFFILVEKNRPDLSIYLPKLSRQIKSVYSAENYLSKWILAEHRQYLILFGLLHKPTNDLIGIILFYKIDQVLKECSIACFLDKKHQGNGFMTQSLKNIFPFCCEKMGIEQFVASVKKDNTRSITMLERLSFTETKNPRSQHLENKKDYRFFEFSLEKDISAIKKD